MSTEGKLPPVTPQLVAALRQAVEAQGALVEQYRQRLMTISQVLHAQTDHIVQTRQRVASLEARQLLVDLGRAPCLPIQFRSQFGEDLWIWDVLGQQTSGFFIEVGAFDGYNFSVTYALEAMGWNGLLIEALPEAADKCRARRTRSRVVHAALGRRGASGTTKFVRVQDQYGGMLSHTQADSEHARQIAQNKFPTSTIEAPCTSLDSLLEGHAGPIDAAVIDVEGAELDVLDGFDLGKHRPRVLIIEDNAKGANPALGEWMATKPYVFAGWLNVNRLYVRSDEAGMLERVKRY